LPFTGRSQICRERSFAERGAIVPVLDSNEQEIAVHLKNGKGPEWINRNCEVTIY
jgi:hypothetical protein